jgi:hypothetical protein
MRFAMLGKRLARLEANCPALGLTPPPDLVGLAYGVLARVMQAKADGTFPRSLCDADLEALVALADQQAAI